MGQMGRRRRTATAGESLLGMANAPGGDQEGRYAAFFFSRWLTSLFFQVIRPPMFRASTRALR